MSEIETQQQTIFGDPLTEQVRVETSGRTIRPWKRMIDEIASEWRLHATEDGFAVDAVDTANVFAIFTELNASAFDTYDIAEETVLGNVGAFGSVLQHARYGKSSDDALTLIADETQIESHVHRPLGDAEATVSERADLADPASIRQEADLPDLDLGVTVEMQPETFVEAVDVLDTANNFVKLGSNTESVVFAQESETNTRNIELACEPTEASEFTYFSGGYIESLATAVRNGYVDSLTLKWDEEFPLLVEFAREDLYEGTMMVAPRIKSE